MDVEELNKQLGIMYGCINTMTQAEARKFQKTAFFQALVAYVRETKSMNHGLDELQMELDCAYYERRGVKRKRESTLTLNWGNETPLTQIAQKKIKYH